MSTNDNRFYWINCHTNRTYYYITNIMSDICNENVLFRLLKVNNNMYTTYVYGHLNIIT